MMLLGACVWIAGVVVFIIDMIPRTGDSARTLRSHGAPDAMAALIVAVIVVLVALAWPVVFLLESTERKPPIA